jgi:hypothetical protein
VVLVTGPRQSGKSTLADLALATRSNAVRLSLDEPGLLAAAREDPVGFIDQPGTVFIDEVQRAPELLLPIKAAVDRANRPGQFLLTGSTNVLMMPRVADVLTGRMQLIELWPFSQGEIDGQIDGFVDRAFAGWPGQTTTTLTKADHLGRAAAGGFPEAVARPDERRRGDWFAGYLDAFVQRDVRDLAAIERPAELRRLLRLLAARSGQLLKVEALARDAGLTPTTARRYIDLLEAAFLIRVVRGWSTSKTTRAIRAPKVFLRDAGMLCHLLGVSADGLLSPTADAGPVLESFATMELARQLGWARTRAELFHFRNKDGTEVDAVLEAADGRVVGVEIKAGATVRSNDFRGLRLLADRLGDRFTCGLVLYSGQHTLSFGDRLRCAPLGALWGTEGGD